MRVKRTDTRSALEQRYYARPWGGTRVLPVDCPAEFRNHPNIPERWPIPRAEHHALRQPVEAAVRSTGAIVADLLPGDCFQPLLVELPSRPKADFLRAALAGPVVVPRVKELFEA